MINIIILCIIFTLFGAVGGFCFKKATENSNGIVGIILSPFLYVGGGFYVLGALLNIVLLKYLNYTIVLPLTSITYVWTLLIAYFFLKESISRRKIIGVTLIIAGAVLLASNAMV